MHIGYACDRLKVLFARLVKEFTFAGSSHQNYMSYLLEVYRLLRHDASNDLRDSILNNWLRNLTGELGKWIEGDLLEEHYNRWLEDMIKRRRRGGNFDDQFYRQTISPNVHHFLRLKEEIESAFELERRAKAHTPHICGLSFSCTVKLAQRGGASLLPIWTKFGTRFYQHL